MKNKRVIILSIITNIILIGIICSLISKNVNIIKEKQIIKEMNESTQITDLNNQINTLNTEHTEYMNYIQTCKTKIATALTNEGVTTSNQLTLEKMSENISKVLQERTSDATATANDIAEGKTAYVNGNKITGIGREKLYLYKEGNEYIQNTGGWNFLKYENRNSTFSKENEYLYIDSTASGAAGYFYTINKELDFSQYNRLCIKAKIYKTYDTSHFTYIAGEFNHHAGVPGEFKSNTNYCYTERNYLTTDTGVENSRNLVLDISELTGKGGIYIYAYQGYEKIYEVWLEK